MYRQTSSSNMTESIKSLMQRVDDDFEAIKNKKENANANDNALTPKELLDRATNNVKSIQESLSSLKNRKGLDEQEINFMKLASDSVNKYNREIRALRFEIKMK